MGDPAKCPGRCWYCGEQTLREGDPPEHVIPDAMSGTLKTDRVCRSCNSLAGKQIDAPFMQDWLIAAERAMYSPRGHRMRPRVEAALEDGTPVDLITGKGPWKGKIRGGIERDGDTVRIRASNRIEYEALIARVRRDAERDGRTFIDPGTPEEFETNGPIVVKAEVDAVVWLRMAAKVTLGCLSKILDERWLDSADAEKYRNWLWDADPVNDEGKPALAFPVEANELEQYVANPPEHLLYFFPAGRGRVVLSIAYFGTMIVRTRVAVEDLPMPRAAWRTTSGAPPVETTSDALLAEAAIKKMAESPDEETS
jgi:hypothetical protein